MTRLVIFFRMMSLGIFLLILGCSGTRPPTDIPQNPEYPPVTLPEQPPPPSQSIVVVGTFNATRAGSMAFASSAVFNQARNVIRSRFPQVRMWEFDTLTDVTLSDVNVLILHVLNDQRGSISPITASEQQALMNYINRGGAVLILTDHIDFANANAGFLRLFNMESKNIARDRIVASVFDASAHPITSGSFGTVTSFSQFWSGGFTKVASNAMRLAGNQLGDALVVFNRGSISSSSGAVVLFSDVSTFIDSKSSGLFSENEILFLNTMSFLIQSIQ